MENALVSIPEVCSPTPVQQKRSYIPDFNQVYKISSGEKDWRMLGDEENIGGAKNRGHW